MKYFLLPIYFFFTFFLSTSLVAAETDAFTSRYMDIADAIPALNLEVNRRVEQALTNLKAGCDWDEVESRLGEQLRNPVRGHIEHYINESKNLPKPKFDFDQSVFQNVPFLLKFPIQVGRKLGIGFTLPIHHEGLLIGADKFGHFFDEGHYYYTLVHKWGFKFTNVLKSGKFLEYTFEGKGIVGIYSYADLAANYDGHRFWLDLLGVQDKKIPSKFLSCDKGKWKLSPIDLKIYVSAAWDEGMNCNDYLTHSMEEGILKSVEMLEKKNGKRYRCPVYPQHIRAMIQRYPDVSSEIINPRLFSEPQTNRDTYKKAFH